MSSLLRYTAALLLMCAPIAARATTIRPMSLRELTRSSSTIAVAQATRVWSQWTPDHRLIYTYTEFSVKQALKGSPSSTIVVQQLGGSVGDVKMTVAGVEHWRSGDETVLFLNPNQSGNGTYLVTGLLQGDFRVSRDRNGRSMVTNPVGSGVESFDTATHQLQEFTPVRMSLTQLQTLVRQYREER